MFNKKNVQQKTKTNTKGKGARTRPRKNYTVVKADG